MDAKQDMFRNRLTKVFKHKSKLARRQSVTCYRVYDHDLPEFPFCIEFYGNNLYVAEYLRRHHMDEEAYDAWMETSLQTIGDVLQVPQEQIFTKQRSRKAGRLGQYQKVADEKTFIEVKENDLAFLVNLTDYLDTGLFLDHRITRGMVRDQAKDKRVLNLFSYTSSFSVYAAAGGASTVTSVDLSKTYLEWSKENFAVNNFPATERYQFIHADVKQYLATLAPGSFDLVIMDPPTFSNSKRMKDFLDIQHDHVTLLNQVIAATSPGGVIYFSTNYTKFILDKANIHSEKITDITRATTPFDFEGKLARWCFRIEVA